MAGHTSPLKGLGVLSRTARAAGIRPTQLLTRQRDILNNAEQLADIEPPEDLSDDAKSVWQVVVPELVRCGIVTTLDTLSLIHLCEAGGDFIAARREIREEGRYQVSPKGVRMLHPAVMAMSEADRRMRNWAKEFGLTPLSRAVMARMLQYVTDPETINKEDDASSRNIDLSVLKKEEREVLRGMVSNVLNGEQSSD